MPQALFVRVVSLLTEQTGDFEEIIVERDDNWLDLIMRVIPHEARDTFSVVLCGLGHVADLLFKFTCRFGFKIEGVSEHEMTALYSTAIPVYAHNMWHNLQLPGWGVSKKELASAIERRDKDYDVNKSQAIQQEPGPIRPSYEWRVMIGDTFYQASGSGDGSLQQEIAAFGKATGFDGARLLGDTSATFE